MRILLFCMVCLVLCAGVNAEEAVKALSKTEVKLPESANANIKLFKAELTEANEQIDIMGKISVTENGTNLISARVAGRIDSIAVASGEAVTKGQVLAHIFSPDYAASREEYLQAMKRRNKNNDSDFGNLYQLSYKKLLTLGLTKEDIADLAKTPSDMLPVHAPVDGVLIAKAAALGASVNQGDPLFTIGDLHKVWFLGDLYPEDLSKVHAGQDVIISEQNGSSIYGRVSFISPIIDPNTRTIKIRVLMENPNQELRSDMYVQAHVILNKDKNITVPNTAIFNEGTKNYIFKQSNSESQVFQKTEVEIGNHTSDKIIVIKGINEGDFVVSVGGLLLNAALDDNGG